jgi:hypothetical protein
VFRLRLGIAAGCALACLVAAGCSGAHGQDQPTTPVRPAPTSSAAATAHSPLGQRGIDVLWYYDQTDGADQVTAKADATFSYIRSLGGNATSISFPVYMTGAHASTVSAGPATPPPGLLAIAVRNAIQHGLRVTVRPELDGAAFGAGGWRGTIEPASRKRWFASYFSVLRPYLEMARQTGAAQFEIGVEFNTLTGDPRWGPLIAKAKQVFPGVIGYSTNWNEFANGNLGPPQVGSQDLDAYFPSSLPPGATVGQLAGSWLDWLSGAAINLRDVVIAETGIAAQSGAYQHPYNPGDALLPVRPQIQQRWYAAACRVATRLHMRGIYFWYLDFNQPPGTVSAAAAPPMSFVGRSASVIRACFERR